MKRMIVAVLLVVGSLTVAARSSQDIVTYIGAQRFNAVFALSDGTFLIGGGCMDLSWLPGDVPRRELTGAVPESDPATGTIPFLLHLSGDGKRLLNLVTLPKGCAQGIRFVRSTNVPGEKTGALFISGRTYKAGNSGKKKEGYFIGRLDGNFVDALPTRILWKVRPWFSGKNATWDVDADGNVCYITGEAHGWDWYSIDTVDGHGQPRIVANWRGHWLADGGYHWGPASTASGKIGGSTLLFKRQRKPGTFRSWTKENFLLKTSDGNGGTKMGKWPFDAMYNGYFDPKTKSTVPAIRTEKGRGYYGYRMADNSCEINAITFDRRTGDLYIGGCNKSKLPDGKPDFEPWIVALSRDGMLRWWQRLYSEEKGVSTPDQYVDNVAIDYSEPAADGSLVLTARAHGNNVNNFWQPKQIRYKGGAPGFQNGFSGTHGNMHFSWIGRLSLKEGELRNCTYFAEYAEQDPKKYGKVPFKDPLVAHWPDFRSGWPNLNTTRVAPGSLSLDDKGNIYLCALGRRPITTSNAYQENPSPLKHPGSKGSWCNFVRVYRRDLSSLLYSSILSGPWDWKTGQGAGPVALTDCTPTAGGLLVVGYSPLDKKTKQVKGSDVPTHNVPAWGRAKRQGETAVFGQLHFRR